MGWLLNILLAAPFLLLWEILVGLPLIILSYISTIFNKIGIELVIRLLFGDSLLQDGKIQIHYVYIAMGVLAAFAFLAVLIGSLLKALFDNEDSAKKQKTIYRKILPALGSIIYYPFVTVLWLLLLFNLQTIMQILFFGESGYDFKLGHSLFMALKPDAYSEKEWLDIANNYNYYVGFSFLFKVSNAFVVMSFFAVLAILVLFQMFTLVFSLISQTMSTFGLFLVHPLVSVWRLYDEDKLYRKWKQIYNQKLSIVFSYSFAMNIFILYINFVSKIELIHDGGWFGNAIAQVILIGGAVGGTQVLIGDISQLFGDRQSVKSGFQVARHATATAAGAAAAVGTGIGFAKGGAQSFAKLSKATKNNLIGENLAKAALKHKYKSGDISRSDYALGKSQLRQEQSQRRIENKEKIQALKAQMKGASKQQKQELKQAIKYHKAASGFFANRQRTGLGGAIENKGRAYLTNVRNAKSSIANWAADKGIISKQRAEKINSKVNHKNNWAQAREWSAHSTIEKANKIKNSTSPRSDIYSKELDRQKANEQKKGKK
ncbi:Mbov_0396 family ICE element transmembrane protein [Mycoplasma sp. 3686d]|uniref:Mbov_0396 family ICE element transmembrane protein n=1 Tax=Mycoplasma sp. 3686d TaxID=2967300 RepID=UPI00211D1209|nr:hypothetical protein [Mycoplasma sp. 3686d]UUM24650.1 hypothetical protein NPA12_03060 [Mycoplasma sp. 3686d]